MPTITVTQANAGQILATNGNLVALRCTASPTAGTYAWPEGLLAICESLNFNVPKAIFNAHIPTHACIAGTTLFEHAMIPYNQLTLVSCPPGAVFTLDIV
jgi:hypothetical protein